MTSSFSPKLSPHFLICPSYLSFLSLRKERQCHKFSNNQSIPSLSSSSFVLLSEGASYLCITGPQYPLTSFCILSTLLVKSLCSQKTIDFISSYPCRHFLCQGEKCDGAVVACFISLLFIFLYNYCSSFSHPPCCFSFQECIKVQGFHGFFYFQGFQGFYVSW